jgi:hypothetical protein
LPIACASGTKTPAIARMKTRAMMPRPIPAISFTCRSCRACTAASGWRVGPEPMLPSVRLAEYA